MGSRNTIIILLLIVLLGLLPATSATTRILHAQEGDYIKIVPEVIDPDNDKIKFTYSAPLDEKGEWQTTFDDAGQYQIEITATDGTEKTIQKLLLIIENRNQAPFAAQKRITVKETETVDLKKTIIDPDNDPLFYIFNEPFDRSGTWKTNYSDAGNYLAVFTVSDGEFEVPVRIEIQVLPSNEAPQIEHSFSDLTKITFQENQDLEFYVNVRDKDTITYYWELDGQKISEESSGKYHFDYDSDGEHTLIAIVNDGEQKTTKFWDILVEKTNRQPKLNLLPVTVNEGEKAIITVPAKDDDDDQLTYSFEAPFDGSGAWQTDFEDQGKYHITIIATDGKLNTEEEIDVTIVNVDRAPVLQLPPSLDAYEGQKLLWKIGTEDPDGDKITLTIDNLPENAQLNAKNKTVTWTPSYNTVTRRGGLWSNILNALRIERFFLAAKAIPVAVKSCGKELCASASLNLMVHNINQPPVLTAPREISVTEGEPIYLDVSSQDPDGDIVRHYFTAPLGKRDGQWKTKDGDEGTYTMYATATDGRSSDTKPIAVHVAKFNHPPSLKIRDDTLTVNEGQQFLFTLASSDPDNDNTTIKLESPPAGSSFKDGAFLWTAPYNNVANKTDRGINKIIHNSPYLNKRLSTDQSIVWLRFTASDGTLETVHPVKVTIKNINQKPEVQAFTPKDNIRIKTNQPVIFKVLAVDTDYDQLHYTWDFEPNGRALGRKEEKVPDTNTIERTFLSPGTKKVRVQISDGWDSIEKEWTIEVEEEPTVEQPVEQIITSAPLQQPLPAPVFKVYIIKK
ncbi:TPA: cadherin repeat domain-containing protein [Candidatus Woesearchaeota archaeon]|nr:cadherin repeat domain-containing protein [Candidatus Woesearchaeota archaeon]